jgi:hypothetical protein
MVVVLIERVLNALISDLMESVFVRPESCYPRLLIRAADGCHHAKEEGYCLLTWRRVFSTGLPLGVMLARM